MCTRSHPGWTACLLLAAAMMFVALPPAAPAGAPPARRDVWAALLKDTLRSVTAIVGPVAQRGNRVAPASTLMGVRG